MADADMIPLDMKQSLEAFDREADEIVGPYAEGLESAPTPDLIYHYTNDSGLRGILEFGTIWFTDIFDLNDPSELIHGLSHAVRALSEKAKTGLPETKVFAEQFARFAREGGVEKSAHYFVCSFSSSGDELGQWRAYADNGRGYALAFDAKELETAFAKERPSPIHNSTFPVSYDNAVLADMHARLIHKAFHLISLPRGRSLTDEVLRAYVTQLSATFTVNALLATVFFKHAAYRNEEEYRFLQIFPGHTSVPGTKFRSRLHSLARYREFDWRSVAAETLKQIVIGPAAEADKGSKFAKDCLRAFHPMPVNITRSAIPYRAS